MIVIRKQWVFSDEENVTELTEEISERLACGELLAGVLQARGIKTVREAEEFLRSSDEEHDPYLLPDIALFLNRIKRARLSGETVCVYGDYDADGVTATAIMVYALEKFGIERVIKYLPDRMTDGYGMNQDAVRKIAEMGAALIVTVDCGISCADEIKYAKSLGIDTVVTDHHTCPEVLPECVAVINPKREGTNYPFGELAGAGVAYKLASVILEGKTEKIASLAAIGTVADVVSLAGENRTIVKKGLKEINENPLPGIAALFARAGKSGEIFAEDISFILAPRINSSGRMDKPDAAYELLTADNAEMADEKAERLCDLNDLRKKEEAKIYKEAVELIKEDSLAEDEVIVVGKEGWHSGVTGIVAARITEAAHKPCMVIAYEGEKGKGSARSVEGINLYDALAAARESLVSFGGHALAAGAVIEKANEAAFRKSINEWAARNVTEEARIRRIKIDLRPPVSAITKRNIEMLSLLEPTGADNAKPVFAIADAKITDMRMLSEGKHLKLTAEKDSYFIEAVKFNVGSMAKKLYTGKRVHLAGTLEMNSYTGRPQLLIKDILY